MAITTYSELQQAINDWSNNPEVSQSVTTFITLAEAKFNRELRLRDMLYRSEAVSSAEYLSLPGDWLETYSLEMVVTATTTIPPLMYIGVNEAKILKANHIQNDPRYYTLINGALELIPAPKDDQDLILTYYQQIPALSVSNTTNWLLTKAPDLYLYSSLLEAAPYLKDPASLQIWTAARQQVIDAMTMESERAMRPTVQLTSRRRGFF